MVTKPHSKKIREQLLSMYEVMRARFGDRHWWPSTSGCASPEGKLEICVGAILTQNTSWSNVEKAVANLHTAGCMSVEALGALSAKKLAELIRPAGYFNVKAKRLGNFITCVRERWGGDIEALLSQPVEELRAELLSVNGVGRETADSMILYAAGQPSFVVDAYTGRIFRRHGLIEEAADYETIKSFFESHLSRDVPLWNDYHAQIVETGKNYCKPTPRCDGCPLRAFLQ
ncbi:MAG: endonuclease III domain-containing protein [Phycisphaerae bacterium]|nr:endonuclease III domain-containing protein [Phycisphaerae bacterium]